MKISAWMKKSPKKRIRRAGRKRRKGEEGNGRTSHGHVGGTPKCKEAGSPRDNDHHPCKRQRNFPEMDQRWNREKQRVDEEQSGTEIQTTLQEAKRKIMEIHDQRSCDRDQDLQDQGKDRDKDWSSFIPTDDAENKKDLESSPKNEIGKRQMMTPSGEKRAFHEEASCGERPYPNEALREEDMVSAGIK